MAWTKELERAASAGKSVPDGLTAPEKALYIAMRGVYWQYREGVITLEQAKREKMLLTKDFDKLEMLMKAQEKALKSWRWLNLRIEEGDCPRCIEMKRTILQLENCF